MEVELFQKWIKTMRGVHQEHFAVQIKETWRRPLTPHDAVSDEDTAKCEGIGHCALGVLFQVQNLGVPKDEDWETEAQNMGIPHSIQREVISLNDNFDATYKDIAIMLEEASTINGETVTFNETTMMKLATKFRQTGEIIND